LIEALAPGDINNLYDVLSGDFQYGESSEGGEGNVDRNLIAAIVDVLEKLQTM
jgi:hypothetical protein